MLKKLTATLITSVALMAGATTHAQAAGYTQTKYPIVLTHGIFGWKNMPILQNYFYYIPESLQSRGAKVYTTQLTGLDSSDARSEQLLTQVKTILAISGAQKVNLFGHSHGASSSRYVAAVIPGKVASVTAIGSPVKGTPVADLVVSVGNAAPAFGSLVYTVLNAFDGIINVLSSDPNTKLNARASMASLSTAGSAAFNARFPQGVPTTACGTGATQVNGIRYYSWGGTTPFTNIFDPLDYFFGLASVAFAGQANDGVVGKCSTHLGQVIRDDYNMNHMDEVNQMMGIHALFMDPTALFRQQANRLQLAGM